MRGQTTLGTVGDASATKPGSGSAHSGRCVQASRVFDPVWHVRRGPAGLAGWLNGVLGMLRWGFFLEWIAKGFRGVLDHSIGKG